MTQYPLHIYVGVFNPLMRIHQTLFNDLAKSDPKLALVAYPGARMDSDDTLNMLRMYQLPDDRIHVIQTQNPQEQFGLYLENAEKIVCHFYTEKEKWLLHDKVLHEQFKNFIPKISWIEITEEHKHISHEAFWAEPERHPKWVHPDVFQLFIKNRILT